VAPSRPLRSGLFESGSGLFTVEGSATAACASRATPASRSAPQRIGGVFTVEGFAESHGARKSGPEVGSVRAVAGKLGRFQEETFSQIEIFVPGRDMQPVHLNDSGTNF
jgi:hypothetical protein